jgi:hypothetical protein
MKPHGAASAAIVVTLAVTSVAAQSGGLHVTVVDAEDNTELSGATVVLSNTQGFVDETAYQTNVRGIADFPILRAGGGYVVEVRMPGYGTVRKTDLRVKIGQTVNLVVALGDAFVEKETVVATADIVDLEETRQTTKFSDEFIQDLPVRGRYYTNVLTLAPGVQDSDGDGNPNVHGSRERDFKAMVGGISNQDPLTGLQLSNVNMDSIEEIEVVTAGAGVEYGRAQGGFANIIEKQGNNEFEGLFTYIYSGGALDGNGATGLSDDRIPDFSRHQPAIQFSGPIVKDKLWYRLSHELISREDPIDTLGSVNVRTFTKWTHSDMITWQVSRRNKLNFRLLSDPLMIENLGVDSRTPPESTYTYETTGPTYGLEWTAPFSPKLLVTSRVAYQDAEVNVRPTTTGVPNDCIEGLELLSSAQCFNVVTGQVSGSAPTTWEDQRQRFTVSSQADIFGGNFWGMNHTFKVGMIVENERYFRHLEQRPSISFFILQEQQDSGGGGNDDIERIGFVNGSFSVPESGDARATGTTWAFYASDMMRPLSNLTITLGARVDAEEINSDGFLPFDPEAEARALATTIRPIMESGAAPDVLAAEIAAAVRILIPQTFTAYESVNDFTLQIAEMLGISETDAFSKINPTAAQSYGWDQRRRAGNINITNTNFAPYLAVSWDPFSTGKTKITATAGRKYDKIFLAIPLIELQPVTTNLSFQATPHAGTGAWRVDDLCRHTGACLQPAINTTTVSRDLETPYTDELTFSVEREIAAETSIAFVYIHREARDQLQTVETNRASGDWGHCSLDQVNSAIVRPSPGSGFLVTDPFTGETYTDTDPGVGDGRIDDCVGEWIFPPLEEQPGDPGGAMPPSQQKTIQRPDGFADTYLQNPGWGQLLLLGNFNQHDYDGFTLVVNRRQYRNWQMNASYTYSKVWGDGEDFDQILGNDPTLVDQEEGYLGYDQRHVVKVNATTIVPWAGGFRFGTAVQWQSGLPYSLVTRRLRLDAIPPIFYGLAAPEARTRLQYETGTRNTERNESWWNFDIHLAKEWNLRGGVNLQVTADVFNLLNDNHLTIVQNVNGNIAAFRDFGRRFQLGFRVAF